MIDEGRLDVTLILGPRQVVDVELRSSRPQHAARMLAHRSIPEALRLAPLLFSLCGAAHGLAVVDAAERAAGVALDPAHQRARALLATADALEGHGWTVFLEWPKLLGQPALVRPFTTLRHFTTQLRTSLYPDGDVIRLGGGRLAPDRDAVARAVDALERLLHEHVVEAGFADDAPSFRRWSGRGRTRAAELVDLVFQGGFDASAPDASDVPLVPELDPGWFASRLARDPDFGGAPRFEGRPAEVGPLARLHDAPFIAELTATWGRGILARFGARLAELVALPERLRELADNLEAAEPGGAVDIGAGEGVGLVTTARGPLAYRLVVGDGRVISATSVAPTEWNFHPEGILTQTLRGAPVSGAARRASLIVASLDPCVPYEVRVRHQTEPPEDSVDA